MNGINMNLFLGGTDFLNANKKGQVDDKKSSFSGKVTGTSNKAKKTDTMQDTVDISGESREIKQAGYSKPKMQIQKEQQSLKAVDENGIQEGVTLSDAAKNLLSTLKEKYGNMDFYIANTDSAEDASYYMDQGNKEYSVLIDPETLEKMAADEDVLSKYENILDGTGEMFASIKKEVGEDDMKSVGAINITFDKDGNTSYIAKILDGMNANKGQDKKSSTVKANSPEELAAKIKEKIAEKKKTQEEQLEKKKEANKATAAKEENNIDE